MDAAPRTPPRISENFDPATLAEIRRAAGLAGGVDVSEFHRYGSARQLYQFHVDNAAAY